MHGHCIRMNAWRRVRCFAPIVLYADRYVLWRCTLRHTHTVTCVAMVTAKSAGVAVDVRWCPISCPSESSASSGQGTAALRTATATVAGGTQHPMAMQPPLSPQALYSRIRRITGRFPLKTRYCFYPRPSPLALRSRLNTAVQLPR